MPSSDSTHGDRRRVSEPTAAMDIPNTVEPAAQEAGDAPPAEAEVGTLVIRRGPQQGARFPVRSTVTTIGRDRDCDVVLDDVTVSRNHAELRHESASFSLADSGSLNGTYVNRAATDRTVLADGDEIWIGKFRLLFEAGA